MLCILIYTFGVYFLTTYLKQTWYKAGKIIKFVSC